MSSRKPYRAVLYRKLFTYCAYPGCGESAEAVHHIRPLSKSGIDTYVNFVCLCETHHMKYRLHSQWQKHETSLLTYKFYQELNILGFTSDIPTYDFLHKIALWRKESGLSCPVSESPQKPVTRQKKTITTHNHGQSKEVTAVKPLKQYRCHWCGGIIDAEKKRKYCSRGCYPEYRRWCKWTKWLMDIVLTREIYLNQWKYNQIKDYLQLHNNEFQVMGGLYGMQWEDNSIKLNIPSGEYRVYVPEGCKFEKVED